MLKNMYILERKSLQKCAQSYFEHIGKKEWREIRMMWELKTGRTKK